MPAKSKSAKYYASHPEARRKKSAYDKKLNARPSQVTKREQSNKMRYRAKRRGLNVSGKDYDHGSGKFIPSSVNRGKRSGTAGDRRSRGRFGRRRS